MNSDTPSTPRLCFVGLGNLPVLARKYARFGAGGAELQQTLLARALVRGGMSVSMVVADHGQPDGAEWDGIRTYKTYGPDEGIPVLRFIHPRWTRLWGALKRANADIYYTSCAGALLGQVVMFARRQQRKVVFRIASDSDCDPDSLLIRYWRDKRLYSYGLHRADLVLAQTQRQQQALRRNFGRESEVVAPLTLPGGRRSSFDERDIDVLWVGNIRQLKHPERLLEAARALPELSFHMIGGPMRGAEVLFERVRAAAAELPNVRFHGSVSHHEMGNFYSRARVLVGTSEIEGFPNSYLQAWAHGTPVIAFLDPERLIAGNGLGSVIADMEALGTAIAALTRDASQWEPVSQRSRDYMDTRINEKGMVAPYVKALSELSRSAGTNDRVRA